MNKISKKIVALATMAAFVLTLVPAAAFAADSSDYTVTTKDAKTATVNISLTTEDKNAIDADKGNVFVWAEDADGVLDYGTEVSYTSENPVADYEEDGFDNCYIASKDVTSVDVAFAKAGDYKIFVAVNDGPDGQYFEGLKDAKEDALKQEGVAFTAYDLASSNASKVLVDAKNAVEVDQHDTEAVTFDLRTSGDIATDSDVLNNVVVWVEDAEGNFTDAVTLSGDVLGATANDSIYSVVNNVNGDTTFNATFNRGGTYYIWAAVGTNVVAASTPEEALVGNFVPLQKATVTVVPAKVSVDNIVLEGENVEGDYSITLDNQKEVYDVNLIGYDGFVANGTSEYTWTGYARQENGDPAEDQEITFTSGDGKNLQFNDGDAATTVTTGRMGQFTVTFTMNDNRNVPVTITVGDKKYTVRVVKEVTRAYDIDTTKDGGYVLAGDDSHWVNNNSADFTDAVEFTILDEAGDVLTGDDNLSAEPATWDVAVEAAGQAEHAKNLRVVSRGDDSTLDSSDLHLVPVGDKWTLAYVGDDHENDLTPGKYVVRVALLSGDYAEATFYVANFGDVVDLDVQLVSHDMSADRDLILDDEVTLGQFVTATTQYVDENGIKVQAPAGNVRYGFNGKAVVDTDFFNGTFWTRADEISNEALIGTEIVVNAFDVVENIDVQKTLTVVDSYNSFDLEFDPTEGAVNSENDVDVTVVKANGDKAQVDGELYAYIEDQSNDDAVVTVDVKKDVNNGKGVLTIYASEPTEVSIRVAVEDDSNQGLYAATLNYTAGDGSIFAHHNVVMTIGSSQYVVDKQLFTMDAAPYVDSNWRTMVPIRALAEAFDATVTYDNDDRTVTIEYNEQTIVMTVDESTYTINGEEAEMDTEAVIKGDRTYVPVRFAAEAMGFTVTALYDQNSSTASVVFQS